MMMSEMTTKMSRHWQSNKLISIIESELHAFWPLVNVVGSVSDDEIMLCKMASWSLCYVMVQTAICSLMRWVDGVGVAG